MNRGNGGDFGIHGIVHNVLHEVAGPSAGREQIRARRRKRRGRRGRRAIASSVSPSAPAPRFSDQLAGNPFTAFRGIIGGPPLLFGCLFDGTPIKR